MSGSITTEVDICLTWEIKLYLMLLLGDMPKTWSQLKLLFTKKKILKKCFLNNNFALLPISQDVWGTKFAKSTLGIEYYIAGVIGLIAVTLLKYYKNTFHHCSRK